MCGIVGLFDMRAGRDIDSALLARMNQTQQHRGPSEGGVHIERGVGLGHRRLSIIDLAGGHQPLYNEDGSVVVVFNGEIYNYQMLTQQLIQKGHTFRTHSDTEVLVHAWEEWGSECVDSLRGMFSFAIWDRRKKTLFSRTGSTGHKAVVLHPST